MYLLPASCLQYATKSRAAWHASQNSAPFSPHASFPLLPARPQGKPAEAQIVSHRYMLRAGMIKQQAAGIYSWLPLGYRVLKADRTDRA
jgi:hypothetical protein